MNLNKREQAIIDMLQSATSIEQVNSLRYWWVANHQDSDARDWIFKENTPERFR